MSRSPQVRLHLPFGWRSGHFLPATQCKEGMHEVTTRLAFDWYLKNAVSPKEKAKQDEDKKLNGSIPSLGHIETTQAWCLHNLLNHLWYEAILLNICLFSFNREIWSNFSTGPGCDGFWRYIACPFVRSPNGHQSSRFASRQNKARASRLTTIEVQSTLTVSCHMT